jgi:hypothetical protein
VLLSRFSGQPRVAHGACSPKSPLLGKHCECYLLQRVLQEAWLISVWLSCNEALPGRTFPRGSTNDSVTESK